MNVIGMFSYSFIYFVFIPNEFKKLKEKRQKLNTLGNPILLVCGWSALCILWSISNIWNWNGPYSREWEKSIGKKKNDKYLP